MSKRQIVVPYFALSAALLLRPATVHATYSIVACDAKTQACGVAVQTNNLAVGASVPYAQAGVGALASQFETNPHYGPRGLTLLAQALSPDEVLKRLLAEDGNFDGAGPEARQVGIVSVAGRAANYTGDEAQHAAWAGARSGSGYTIQGNGLTGAAGGRGDGARISPHARIACREAHGGVARWRSRGRPAHRTRVGSAAGAH